MNYEVITKELPQCVVYYKEGVIEDFSKVCCYEIVKRASLNACFSYNIGKFSFEGLI